MLNIIIIISKVYIILWEFLTCAFFGMVLLLRENEALSYKFLCTYSLEIHQYCYRDVHILDTV